MYKIVRHYSKIEHGSQHLTTKRRTIQTGLSLEQAQAHCSDPETSSKTCTRNTVRDGWTWFDGYTET